MPQCFELSVLSCFPLILWKLRIFTSEANPRPFAFAHPAFLPPLDPQGRCASSTSMGSCKGWGLKTWEDIENWQRYLEDPQDSLKLKIRIILLPTMVALEPVSQSLGLLPSTSTMTSWLDLATDVPTKYACFQCLRLRKESVAESTLNLRICFVRSIAINEAKSLSFAFYLPSHSGWWKATKCHTEDGLCPKRGSRPFSSHRKIRTLPGNGSL